MAMIVSSRWGLFGPLNNALNDYLYEPHYTRLSDDNTIPETRLFTLLPAAPARGAWRLLRTVSYIKQSSALSKTSRDSTPISRTDMTLSHVFNTKLCRMFGPTLETKCQYGSTEKNLWLRKPLVRIETTSQGIWRRRMGEPLLDRCHMYQSG